MKSIRDPVARCSCWQVDRTYTDYWATEGLLNNLLTVILYECEIRCYNSEEVKPTYGQLLYGVLKDMFIIQNL